MVEKQDSLNQHLGSEEKNYKFEFKELNSEIYGVETHEKVITFDTKEVKNRFDEFPSKQMIEADAQFKPKPASTNCFVSHPSLIKSLSRDKFQSKASDLDAALGLCHGLDDCTTSKPRKKRRPQSLNLGGAVKLIHRNGDDSSSAEEENQGSLSDNSCEQSALIVENHCESSLRVLKRESKGDPPLLKGLDSGYLDTANGSEKPTHNRLLGVLKDERERKVQIFNKDLAEVRLRQVTTHDKSGDSFAGEGAEGQEGRTSLRRLSCGAGGGNHPGEITRIVLLNPERSKNVVCKDVRDTATPEELTSRFFRREYRWSMESSMEEATDFHGSDNDPPERAHSKGPSLASKISLPHKTVPPAPPVKTQKTRESGQLLRNNRSVSSDCSIAAAKKRHSVTVCRLPSLASRYFSLTSC